MATQLLSNETNLSLLKDENILSTFTSIDLYFNNETTSYGNGTLFVTTSRCIWKNNNTLNGFAWDFCILSLHAICRETNVGPCLYVQVCI